MLGALSVRYVAKSLVVSRTLRHQYQYRPTQRNVSHEFSTTPRRLASEVPDEFINAIKHTPLFKKLADKPNALKALSDLYALTKEMGAHSPFRPLPRVDTPPVPIEGLDVNSKTPPSQYQMFKLVTDRKFMRAVKRVMEELKAAGLKMNSDVCSLSFGAHGETLTWFPFLFFSLPRSLLSGRAAGDYGFDSRESKRGLIARALLLTSFGVLELLLFAH
jgi:hypothetical protein